MASARQVTSKASREESVMDVIRRSNVARSWLSPRTADGAQSFRRRARRRGKRVNVKGMAFEVEEEEEEEGVIEEAEEEDEEEVEIGGKDNDPNEVDEMDDGKAGDLGVWCCCDVDEIGNGGARRDDQNLDVGAVSSTES